MKKAIYISIAIAILIGLGIFAYFQYTKTDGNPGNANTPTNINEVACTLEAKLCPDGTAVGRTGPNCAFATCPEVNSILTESDARTIAETSCIKGGESLTAGIYNKNTQTWWYDANLNATREGCTPACVVNEQTKTAEINWRCIGAAEPQ